MPISPQTHLRYLYGFDKSTKILDSEFMGVLKEELLNGLHTCSLQLLTADDTAHNN
jgi:hypothetical protein